MELTAICKWALGFHFHCRVREQGKYADAEGLDKRVLAIFEKGVVCDN
jgi:hypothetical protein